MIGAGAAGAVCGLSGGLIISLLQFLSGETVEERWRKEFKLIEVFFLVIISFRICLTLCEILN